MADPMYSTDEESDEDDSPGDFENDQEPEDRTPRHGNAPAPGRRPSESGSTPSDLTTEPD